MDGYLYNVIYVNVRLDFRVFMIYIQKVLKIKVIQWKTKGKRKKRKNKRRY